jgi:hypothetical protein
METRLEYILTNSYKDEMISYITSHPGDFDELINLAISNKQPYSWRAAWLLWSCMEKNDRRITGYVKEIIDVLHLRNDNQLRELLMILQRMELNEKHEGALFDICVNIWKEIGKKPSIRHKAFQHIVKIAKKYPELSNEVIFLTQSRYLASLSEGVKKSIYKMIDKL